MLGTRIGGFFSNVMIGFFFGNRLHPVYDVPLHVPVQGIVVTSANTHMLIPLRDGNLAVIGLPNTIQKP